MKRKYTKKDTAYWQSLANKNKTTSSGGAFVSDWEPTSEPMVSSASCVNYSNRSRSAPTLRKESSLTDRFSFLSGLGKPFEATGRIVSPRNVIELCEAVYANIASFKNVVDIMTEFSCAEWYLEGGTQSSKKFVKKWLKKIRINSFMDQFFREYYRSGNVFIYTINGRITEEDTPSKSFSKIKIPVKFIILNPKEIIAETSPSYEGQVYTKILSIYEIQALKDKKKTEFKDLWDSLPPEVKKQVDGGGSFTQGIDMSLDASRLTSLFFKKQDYEPFAIPFGYPVFGDIEKKEILKDLDIKISLTVENIILLITVGDKDLGVNEKLLKKLQDLFKESSVGRTLVSDWTTKAQFVVPEISNILDPRKYEVLNKDIQEGLLNVFVGSEKFSNQMIKAQVFLERLKEGRKELLEKFLQPQIDTVCKEMGFRHSPEFKFTEIDLEDSVQLRRVWLRMLELGVFTPEMTLEAMRSGSMPDEEDLIEAQRKYIKKREEGMFNPLVGGSPVLGKEDVSVDGDKNEPAQNAPNPNSTENGRPSISLASLVKPDDVKSCVQKINRLYFVAGDMAREKYGIAEMSEAQLEAIDSLVEQVVSTKPMQEWEHSVSEWVEKNNKVSPNDQVVKGIAETSKRLGTDKFQSGLIYHSCQEKQ